MFKLSHVRVCAIFVPRLTRKFLSHLILLSPKVVIQLSIFFNSIILLKHKFESQALKLIKQQAKQTLPMTIGTGTTLIGLLNATIGGSMLMLPILSMKAGYLDWSFSCIILCMVCMYTAYLLVKHLGKSKNIKFLILGHFKGDRLYTTLYNMVIWFSFMSTQIIYFKLFHIQIVGLFETDLFVAEGIAIFLVVWVIALRECDFSELALASGITSIIGYIAYLIWMVDTAPSGPRHIPATTPTATPLILTLLNSYTTHDFMIQVIIFNPNRKDYPKIVLLLFLIANCVYMFTCFSAQGLINRVPGTENPETIIDFFEGSVSEGADLFILQVLYVIHILTAFPEFLIVSKIRIFQIFQIEHNPQNDITVLEALYIVVTIGVSYCVKKFNVPLSLILDFSGALLGYVFSMFIPILIHLKCLHFDRSSGYIKGDDERNLSIVSNECECDLVYRSKYALWVETFILLFIDIYGGIYFLGALKSEFFKELDWT